MSRARMTLVAILVAASAVHVLLASQEPQFRTGTHTVPVYATVVGADGQLITDLTRDDFEVFDNGRSQPVTTFVNDVQPITVVVMLDRSGSVEMQFALVRDAALAFVDALLPGDMARIGSFSRRVQIDPEGFTGDREELRDILWHRLQPVGATPLWNATSVALSALQEEQGRRVVVIFSDGRDAPLTIGGAWVTNVPFGEVRRRVEQEDTMVYVIGLVTPCPQLPSPGAAPNPAVALSRTSTAASWTAESSRDLRWQRGGGGRSGPAGPGGAAPRGPGGTGGRGGPGVGPRSGPGGGGGRGGMPVPIPGRLPFPVPGRGMPPMRPAPPRSAEPWLDSRGGCAPTGPDPSLRTLADAGGGGYFELTEAEDLRHTFTRIADELHQQYLLGFVAPEHDGAVHRVEVRVARPGVNVRARSRYVAPARGQ